MTGALQHALYQIRKRAGVSSSRHETPVYLARDPMRPPTKQQVNHNGRLRNGKKYHGNTSRRVLVGVMWLQQNLPDVWAALLAARMTDGTALPSYLDREN